MIKWLALVKVENPIFAPKNKLHWELNDHLQFARLPNSSFRNKIKVNLAVSGSGMCMSESSGVQSSEWMNVGRKLAHFRNEQPTERNHEVDAIQSSALSDHTHTFRNSEIHRLSSAAATTFYCLHTAQNGRVQNWRNVRAQHNKQSINCLLHGHFALISICYCVLSTTTTKTPHTRVQRLFSIKLNKFQSKQSFLLLLNSVLLRMTATIMNHICEEAAEREQQAAGIRIFAHSRNGRRIYRGEARPGQAFIYEYYYHKIQNTHRWREHKKNRTEQNKKKKQRTHVCNAWMSNVWVNWRRDTNIYCIHCEWIIIFFFLTSFAWTASGDSGFDAKKPLSCRCCVSVIYSWD